MRSLEGLETSGGPVRIICTKFRPISMVHERAMTKNSRGGGVGVLLLSPTQILLKPTQNLPESALKPGEAGARTFLNKFEYEKSIFGPPEASHEVPGGFRKLRGTGTNHWHLVSVNFHGP